ncbi:hypothetical protein PROFUN_03612 [Planoprotostelium fungivorum]|uniref:60S ribosomal protein L39 n=1 Tax=Planoprotostelium fungivorum TaxID=1890364 RepID=A0A2P6MSL1_9EUKA|nr:hypothetical protein PROFUN_03612 [Planoprotostelium fungivorum]
MIEEVRSDAFLQPSHKSLYKKLKLAKAQNINRPLPQWIRLRTGNTIRDVTGDVPSLTSKRERSICSQDKAQG